MVVYSSIWYFYNTILWYNIGNTCDLLKKQMFNFTYKIKGWIYL